MPIYEFECNACGHRYSQLFRRMSSSDEKLDAPCPACQSSDTRRVVSSFALHGGSGSAGVESAGSENAAPKQPAVTPKEQIDRWRAKKP
jgi:putative FmdB family regulatory protein